MTSTTSIANDGQQLGQNSFKRQPGVLIVEAPAGLARQQWIHDQAQTMADNHGRVFSLSCDFDLGGPWAGVSQMLLSVYDDVQRQRPDLIERHSLELVYAVPQLRRSVIVRNPNLTDLAPAEEKTRNYPADRAFRNVHGLIDLLDQWKIAISPEEPWILACDAYDAAGAMSRLFFRELARRRGERLNIQLLLGVQPGNGKETRSWFEAGLPVDVITVDLVGSQATALDPVQASRKAAEIEMGVAREALEVQANLSDLIRLWRMAARNDKLLHYKVFGLSVYNTLGLYEDALRYGDGLLNLASECSPHDKQLRWNIIHKLLMCHIGLDDVQTCLKLVEEEGLKAVEGNPQWTSQLFYLIAMFYARFLKPRDLVKGEEYLNLSLAASEQSEMPEGERHFDFVFNRNGLAMIRNFQGRHQEAIELCRDGVARLNAHLSADQHRLHRSILHYNIAQVYSATGSYQEAIQYYSSAMSMDPNYSEYYNERGNILLHQGRLQEAYDDYLKAIELSPPYFEVFTNLGQCCRRMGAMGQAIESYSKALDIRPNHVLALLGRAKAHEELGFLEAAIEDYSGAIALDSGLWEAVASRGVLHYESGNLTESLADFDRAIQLKAGQPDLYQNRATVLMDLGRYPEALADLHAALELNPDDEDKLSLRQKIEAILQGRH